MPRSVGGSLASHIAGEVTSLATIWKVTRTDGTVYRFTDHDVDLPVPADGTYLASSGFRRSAIAQDASLSVDNLEVVGLFDSNLITEADLRAGKFDYAEVLVRVVNWADLTQGHLKMRRGWLGQCTSTPRGWFRSELRGLLQALQQTIGELYSPHCRADLGDSRCKFPIRPATVLRNTLYHVGDRVRVDLTAVVPQTEENFKDLVFRCTVEGTTHATVQPTYDEDVGDPTVDGTATFVAESSISRLATVQTVTDRRQFSVTELTSTVLYPNDWFNGGAVYFIDGANAGFVREVKDWVQDPSRTVKLFLAVPYTIAVGNRVRIYPGCDKRVQTCSSKFNNVINFRGEPHVPGTDYVASYPDAV